MKRRLGSLGPPPLAVVLATLIGWSIILYVLLAPVFRAITRAIP